MKEKSGSEDGDFETSCMSDAMLSVLGEGFSKLEKLSLIWCNNVTSTGLASLAQKCSLLKSLDLQVNLWLFELNTVLRADFLILYYVMPCLRF